MSEMRENLHPSAAAVTGQREQVRVMTASAVCVALLAVSAYISFPLPFTPAMVTALTIMVNLVAFVMKPKQAGIIRPLAPLRGAGGGPVFGGGTSGLIKLLGPTGGFNLGFLAAAVAMSAVRGNTRSFKKLVAIGICVRMSIFYICGCISMYAVAKVGVWKTLVMAVFPFLIGDTLKVVLAAFLANRLQRYGF
ncbi:biotin transporter BioY [Acidaminococcus fermentans]|uniref:biotin transporter BioY n=1 Tax=Acidaminococcus fermentans TaxID=905 RepID=UPI00307904D9